MVGAGNGEGEEEGALAKEVAKLKEENMLLIRDLENMCMQGSGTMFDSSFVVSERIYSLEAELAEAKAGLSAVRGERDSLREDIAQMKHLRRDVDSEWRAQAARNTHLESEVQFYQRQSVTALAERDEALVDAEETKRAGLALERRVREAVGRAEEEARLRADAQAALAAAEGELTALRARVKEVEALEAVKAALAAAERRVVEVEGEGAELKAANEALEAEVRRVGEALAGETLEVERLRGEVEAVRAKAEAEGTKAEEEGAKLRALLASAEQAAGEANANREEFEDSLYAARAEVELSRKAAAEAEAREAAARAGEREAEARLASARERHVSEYEGLEAVQGAANELKMRLAQATAEKVEVMMQLADLREVNRQLSEQVKGKRQK